ncbi:hypothetical protein V8C44DRAFT_322632 [Trichoderma aethiopicum]
MSLDHGRNLGLLGTVWFFSGLFFCFLSFSTRAQTLAHFLLLYGSMQSVLILASVSSASRNDQLKYKLDFAHVYGATRYFAYIEP